jgi:nucleoside-diphosphate-sugar epimerase
MSGIRTMLEGRKASFTKGEQMWDYVYVKDAAAEILAAGEKGVDGKIYIIGSGTTRPLKEYFEIIRDKIDSALKLGLGDIPYFDGQVMYLCADNKSLLEDTGYTPKYTFEEGIEETIEWVKKSKN